MGITHLDPFIQKLMKALGIDADKAIGFELRCYCDEIVTVKLEYYPDPSEGETITERFRLERMDEDPDFDIVPPAIEWVDGKKR